MSFSDVSEVFSRFFFALVTVFKSSFVFRCKRRRRTISFSIPPRKWSEYVSTLERKKSWRTRNFNKTTVFNESCKLNKSQANVLKFFPYRIRQRNVTQRNTTQRKDNSASASTEIQESNSNSSANEYLNTAAIEMLWELALYIKQLKSSVAERERQREREWEACVVSCALKAIA